MEKMRAIVFKDVGQLVLQERPIPHVKEPDDVLLKVRSVGICGSDIKIVEGKHHFKPDTVLGHEFCGEVVEVGSHVRHVKLGDRVAIVLPGAFRFSLAVRLDVIEQHLDRGAPLPGPLDRGGITFRHNPGHNQTGSRVSTGAAGWRFAPAHELFGFLEMAQGENLATAEQQLQLAIQLEPENPGYAFSLAQVQLRNRAPEAARRTLAPLLRPNADARLRAHAEELMREPALPSAYVLLL